MRYIPDNSYVPTDKSEWDKWLRTAIKTMKRLAAMTPTARKTQLQKSSPWSDLKPAMTLASGGKCWYCESPLTRQFGAVDHFRPKGGIHGVTNHPGYWWLAYCPQNYRLSCDLCNSPHGGSGKGTHFPVNGGRASQPRSAVPKPREAAKDYLDRLAMTVAKEQPVLLDPMVRTDCAAFTWTDTCTVVAIADRRNDGMRDRLKETARILDLDGGRLARNRRAVADEVKQLVEDWRTAVHELLTYRDGTRNSAVRLIRRAEARLEQVLSHDAPHLSVAEQAFSRHWLSRARSVLQLLKLAAPAPRSTVNDCLDSLRSASQAALALAAPPPAPGFLAS